jgi:hypothetical protein
MLQNTGNQTENNTTHDSTLGGRGIEAQRESSPRLQRTSRIAVPFPIFWSGFFPTSFFLKKLRVKPVAISYLPLRIVQ